MEESDRRVGWVPPIHSQGERGGKALDSYNRERVLLGSTIIIVRKVAPIHYSRKGGRSSGFNACYPLSRGNPACLESGGTEEIHSHGPISLGFLVWWASFCIVIANEARSQVQSLDGKSGTSPIGSPTSIFPECLSIERS